MTFSGQQAEMTFEQVAIFTTWDLDVELVGSQSPRCPEDSKTLHVASERLDAAWAQFASPVAPSTRLRASRHVLNNKLSICGSLTLSPQLRAQDEPCGTPLRPRGTPYSESYRCGVQVNGPVPGIVNEIQPQ